MLNSEHAVRVKSSQKFLFSMRPSLSVHAPIFGAVQILPRIGKATDVADPTHAKEWPPDLGCTLQDALAASLTTSATSFAVLGLTMACGVASIGLSRL